MLAYIFAQNQDLGLSPVNILLMFTEAIKCNVNIFGLASTGRFKRFRIVLLLHIYANMFEEIDFVTKLLFIPAACSKL